MASGCYFPSLVREVEIPKKDGKKRKLGIPTIADRIAQQVVKSYLEPRLEKVFDCRSYGYRPLKSTHQAVEEVRQNVRRYDWVIDLDIKGFFDNVSHGLLIKALDRHVEEKWVKMYVQRWLEVPIELAEKLNPQLRGWFTYYGKFRKWELDRVARRFHFRLVKWACSKYKRFRKSKAKAYQWLKQVRDEKPHLFYHWKLGYKTM